MCISWPCENCKAMLNRNIPKAFFKLVMSFVLPWNESMISKVKKLSSFNIKLILYIFGDFRRGLVN